MAGLLAVSMNMWTEVRASATESCSPNPIVCENSLPGASNRDWDIMGAGDDTIQGFATAMSVDVGQRIDFKIRTDAPDYTVKIYRLGWYGGSGAREVDSVTPSIATSQSQPECVTDSTTEIFDCGNWGVSASWQVPTDAVSGVYIATLRRIDTGGKSQITFVVRNDSSTSDLLFKTSDATWQAYNMYGGSNFYHGTVNGRAYKISYNRPFATRGNNSGRDFLFSNEYPMLRFLERNGYDVSYFTDVDTGRNGALIRNHRVFLSVGHDEYWSGPQRANVEAARDAGVNLAFFSGNEVYWKTRWEPSQDGTSTPHRTLVCYKETFAGAKIDPSAEWTGTWRDPRLSPPTDGGRPENALTGTAYVSNDIDLPIQVPAEHGRYRFWRDTDIASLPSGSVATLAPHTIGYEADEDLDNGFRPPGLIRLSHTVGPSPQYLQDFGTTVAPGTTTHNLTLYRAASGALVFSAGTIQWAWGLDDYHDGVVEPVDVRMQQATVNLFADMRAQPATLMSGLTAQTPSTDVEPPTVSITTPAADGITVDNGSQVTVSGTAVDVGGQVAAIEASTDGGATWRRANGTTSWSYSFFATGVTAQNILIRGVDDSLNITTVPATRQLRLTSPASLFGQLTPRKPADPDGSAVELGVRVVPRSDGHIVGVRFYKGTDNTGTHTGTLWSSTGEQLATGTFSEETASGWQTLTFSAPVEVTAGTTYVASYYAPSGHYAADQWAFSYAGVTSGPLSTPRSQVGNGNGLYRSGRGFPNKTFRDANYYVDVLFLDATVTVPGIVSTTPMANEQYVSVSRRPRAVFSKAVDPATVQFTLTDSQNAAVAGSMSYDALAKAATFTPSAPLGTSQRYTARIQASDTSGNPMSSPAIWSFTTDEYASVFTLFPTDAVPRTTAVNDTSGTTLGVKFTPSVGGSLVGIRFYQGPGNTGTHTATLWPAGGGTPLARATFTNETGSGWQTVHFATPVSVTAGTTYVAAYFAPNGHYAADTDFFTSQFANGSPATMTAAAGTNGVYLYGSDGYPNNSYRSSNYWVDPIFIPGSDPTPTPIPSGTPTGSPTPTTSATPIPTCSPVPPPPLPAGTSTLFGTATPANTNWNDPKAIEVGVRFTADVAGVVTGLRFYKGAQNTGAHVGTLWSSTGQQLAQATFQDETCAGWQTVTFSQPITVTTNTTYVASYSTTVGYYSADLNAFTTTTLRPPLRVPTSGAVYRYGGGFPTTTSKHNYWVDIIFQAG